MNYKNLIQMRDQENPFSVFLGIKTTKIEEGYAEVELKLRPEYLNPTKGIHGGCLYTLGDVASGAAAASFGTKAVTVSGEYHYLAAAKNTEKVKACAKCIKRGKTLVFFDVELTDDQNNLVGKGTFVYYRLLKEIISFD